MTPIYQTSTFVQDAPGVNKGFEYARSQNPTRFALEEALAVIENGRYGLAFSSGVAATDAVIKLLSPGDEVITSNDLYGGSYRLFSKVFEKFGIKFHYVNMTDTENLHKYLNKKTKLICQCIHIFQHGNVGTAYTCFVCLPDYFLFFILH